jgi:hypothetical protein
MKILKKLKDSFCYEQDPKVFEEFKNCMREVQNNTEVSKDPAFNERMHLCLARLREEHEKSMRSLERPMWVLKIVVVVFLVMAGISLWMD